LYLLHSAAVLEVNQKDSMPLLEGAVGVVRAGVELLLKPEVVEVKAAVVVSAVVDQ